MKRVCFSLLFPFLIFTTALPAQNLIPNPSVEDYVECPEALGGTPDYVIDNNIVPWQSLRGTPDYFNSCQTNDGLGWNNDLGYQEPRTGDGYLGAIMYVSAPPNSKEYFGIPLTEELSIGETYYCTFHVSLAFRDNWFRLAVDRIGFLMMTENYLPSYAEAPTPNYVTYEVQDIISDTTNWVEISTSFVADSAYSMIAFGVFYDNDSLTVIAPFTDDTTGQAYYFFEDFCLTTDPEGCSFTTGTKNGKPQLSIQVYPNPSSGKLKIRSPELMQGYELWDIQGRMVKKGILPNTTETEIGCEGLQGMYNLKIITKKGVQSRRVLFK